MDCAFCKKHVEPAESNPAHLEKWEQIEVHTFRGGSLLLLVAKACPTCVEKLQPGFVTVAFAPVA